MEKHITIIPLPSPDDVAKHLSSKHSEEHDDGEDGSEELDTHSEALCKAIEEKDVPAISEALRGAFACLEAEEGEDEKDSEEEGSHSGSY